jgi:hypothetical protein
VQVTKPKVAVIAPPGEQVQGFPVYNDDGSNSLQGIAAEKVLQLTVLQPRVSVGATSQLQGE